jgi:hypothetical protein
MAALENRQFVDQRLRRVAEFIGRYEPELARQGAIVATWRCRGGRRTGPYYLLTIRDASGRQRSVYLGADSPTVTAARAALTRLQAGLVQRRQFGRLKKQLRQGLRAARRELDQELSQVGLRRKGSEIRGWSVGS